MVGVEDPLGPLGGLACRGQRDRLGKRHVLLGEKVLLQLQVVDPIDEQAKDDGLAVVLLGLTGHIAADELHVTL